MASTYEKIATTTLGSDTATVTFSAISGSYTDLVLVLMTRCTGAQNSAGMDLLCTVNSDSGSNYSQTNLTGNGSAASSNRNTNATSFFLGSTSNKSTNDWPIVRASFNNYSNTTTYKSVLIRQDTSESYTVAKAGLWRSTSAITSLSFTVESSLSFKSGSTFTLYGILKA